LAIVLDLLNSFWGVDEFWTKKSSAKGLLSHYIKYTRESMKFALQKIAS